MEHAAYVWASASYAKLAMSKMISEYDIHLRGRTAPVKAGTRDKYRKSLLSLCRSIERAGEPAVLASVTPSAVSRWVLEQREAKLSEDGIASRLSAVKVFTNGFLHKHLELTTVDLLRKVSRIDPPEHETQVLTLDEMEEILNCFDRKTFEDIRNKAFMACLMATGARVSEIRTLAITSFDPASGALEIMGKGSKPRLARLSDRAMKLLKAYLRERPDAEDGALWTDRDGKVLSEWGVHSVMRRLKDRCGIPRVHAHLFRHTFGHMAIDKGAERAAVMDMMGHETDLMSRRYTRAARKRTAANMMPKFSPI